MLATGSADTTVRMWDVGQQLLPHAHEWRRTKRRLLSSQQNEAQGAGDDNVDSELRNISTLENALVRHDNGENNNPTARHDDGDNINSQARKKSSQPAGAENIDTVVFSENVRRAVRSLRPEIIRQAGARAVWRTGRVTAVLEQTGRPANHPAGVNPTIALAQKPGNVPLIEVRDRMFQTSEVHAGKPKQRRGNFVTL